MTNITTDEWLAELERYSQSGQSDEFRTTKQIARIIYQIPDSVDDDDIPPAKIVKTRQFVRKLVREGRAIEGTAYAKRLGANMQGVPGVKLVDNPKGKRR